MANSNPWTGFVTSWPAKTPWRVYFGPDPLDFLSLPAAILQYDEGPHGVVFHCLDGLYLLHGDRTHEETWTILLVWR